MERPSREQSLMDTAYIWARRSTCERLHVGAVVHRDGRILVTGYNGAPAGMSHCNHHCTCRDLHGIATRLVADHWPDCDLVQACTTAEHAERNAIAFAARHGVGLEGAAMVVTHQPCKPCAMSVVNAGIVEVVYAEPYRLRDGLDLLLDAGVSVRQAVDVNIPF